MEDTEGTITVWNFNLLLEKHNLAKYIAWVFNQCFGGVEIRK